MGQLIESGQRHVLYHCTGVASLPEVGSNSFKITVNFHCKGQHEIETCCADVESRWVSAWQKYFQEG